MNLESFVQEFTDEDSGEIERLTVSTLELWTEAGCKIVPPGFRFSFRTIPWPFYPDDATVAAWILHEWEYSAGNEPRRAADRALLRNLIKYPQKRKDAGKGPFWRFVKAWICYVMVRATKGRIYNETGK